MRNAKNLHLRIEDVTTEVNRWGQFKAPRYRGPWVASYFGHHLRKNTVSLRPEIFEGKGYMTYIPIHLLPLSVRDSLRLSARRQGASCVPQLLKVFL